MTIIKQSTYETCLAACLLMLADKDGKYEVEIWQHGWKFNYLIGQLNYFSQQYNKDIEVYIENTYYFNQLQTEKGEGVRLINKEIDTKLLEELLQNGPVITYLDCYYLQGVLHAPHFVLVMEKIDDEFKVADPNDGTIKMIPVEIINKAILSLRNHLKYSPVLVRFL